MATIIDIPSPEATESPIDPQKTDQKPTTPAPPAAKRHGRPPKAHTSTVETREPAFFEKVAKVPAEDWGTRAYIYVYVSEPVCVPKTWGETKYLIRSREPILDLQGLKEQYGSFKGWMSLNVRKSGKDATDQVDRYEFEIMDPLYPPKFPKAAWANDSRNKRWEALLPPEQPTATAAAASFQEAIGVYKGIVNDVKSELKGDQTEPPAPADPTKSTLETLKLAKEIFGTAGPATPALDPFDLASKIMAMRSNDPMMAILLQRMDAQDKALEASRAREFELQKQVMEARTQPAANGNGKDFFAQLVEFGGDTIKQRIVSGIFGGSTAEAVSRPARTTMMDLFRDAIPEILKSPIASGLGMWLGSLATRAPAGMPTNPGLNGNGAMAPNPMQPQATQETEVQRLNRIATQIATPMIVEFFEVWARTGDPGNSGDSFGMRVYDMWPQDFEFLQSIGAERLSTMILSHPMAGARLQPQEQKFRQFIADFLAYDTGEEEPMPAPPAQQTAGRSGIIDVEEEGA